MSSTDPNVGPFQKDASSNEGYLYTTNAPLSSRLANARLTEATMAVCNLKGRTVLDIGCGDGTYTVDLFDLAAPSEMVGVEPAAEAVEVARRKAGGRPITFEVHGAHALPYGNGAFDVAHLRGVLHHLDAPEEAFREAFRVAREVVVVEPNGYNVALKALEKLSRYHREHGEKSYAPARLNHWVRGCGGTVRVSRFVGLVPFFCPDAVAHFLKRLEPVVEALPGLRALGCAVYVFSAGRDRKEDDG